MILLMLKAALIFLAGGLDALCLHRRSAALRHLVWTVTLSVTPGRHVYSFVVDGERWIADPRAPRATDTDFGRPGSVLFVGTP